MKSLNKLLSFSWYCLTHRQERFWQALKNWSESENILVDNEDTFYWE